MIVIGIWLREINEQFQYSPGFDGFGRSQHSFALLDDFIYCHKLIAQPPLNSAQLFLFTTFPEVRLSTGNFL